MSTDFFELAQPDNQYVIINRAYIVSLKPNNEIHEDGAVLRLNRDSVDFSSIHVMPNEVNLLKQWLLEERD
jgi:hypothetical protein